MKAENSAQKQRPRELEASSNGETAAQVMNEARRLGFDLIGTVPVYPAQAQPAAEHYRAWLEKGFHGGMAYLARPDAVAKRKDLSRIQAGVCSVLSVAVNYHMAPIPEDLARDRSRGIVARYAWGDDYHQVLLPRLRQLADHIGELIAVDLVETTGWRAYVDTGPLLERDLAVRAGLGFIGKNTCLISPGLGSWLLLGEILANRHISLPAESLAASDRKRSTLGTCGACTRCLDACPTGALVAPYQLDARRCISYLTIELKGAIPRELRPLLGNHIFGCDICQEVCPWNRRFGRATKEPSLQPGEQVRVPALLELMALDEEGFRRRFKDSPLKRAKRRGLLRNVAVALGNWGDSAVVPALEQALFDPEPLVRGHAAWALGRVQSQAAKLALRAARRAEVVNWVVEEMDHSLVNFFPQAMDMI